MIEIRRDIVISDDEIVFTFTRSGGPGGQNVNKVNSRVTLFFDIEKSAALSDYQKRVIRAKLATRISKDGVLRVVSQKYRTQAANKREATERFVELLQKALERKPVRKKTKVPRSAVRKRLNKKKQRGETKKLRKNVDTE